MRLQVEQQWTLDFAAFALANGYRVFIASNGNYGFITNNEGNRVVCFQTCGLECTLSGNYRPLSVGSGRTTGSGWRISDELPTTKEALDKAFNQAPPTWATCGHKVCMTTMEQHLSRYDSSSKYTEYKG